MAVERSGDFHVPPFQSEHLARPQEAREARHEEGRRAMVLVSAAFGCTDRVDYSHVPCRVLELAKRSQ